MLKQRPIVFTQPLELGAKLPLVAAFALAILTGGNARADSNVAERLIDLAGIPPHLAIAADSIAEEGFANYNQCRARQDSAPTDDERAAFTAMIQRHFGPTQTRARAIETMASRMSEADLQQVVQFFESDLGKKIVKAETDSKDITEEEFVKAVNEYVNSPVWTATRKTMIDDVSAATRAVRFVSLLNGEMTVATKVASQCDATEEGYAVLNAELNRERTDARFVEPIMAGSINLVIASIFRDLSDQELQDYLAFAESAVGKSYFNSLLNSTQRALMGGLAGVRQERIEN